ncbi:unnamed protein product [Amoebophrya sp. A120]|nr:unnamed protein product [Amoebophrya sp. A120]|eukprot:GSA120T00025077001.1
MTPPRTRGRSGAFAAAAVSASAAAAASAAEGDFPELLPNGTVPPSKDVGEDENQMWRFGVQAFEAFHAWLQQAYQGEGRGMRIVDCRRFEVFDFEIRSGKKPITPRTRVELFADAAKEGVGSLFRRKAVVKVENIGKEMMQNKSGVAPALGHQYQYVIVFRDAESRKLLRKPREVKMQVTLKVLVDAERGERTPAGDRAPLSHELVLPLGSLPLEVSKSQGDALVMGYRLADLQQRAVRYLSGSDGRIAFRKAPDIKLPVFDAGGDAFEIKPIFGAAAKGRVIGGDDKDGVHTAERDVDAACMQDNETLGAFLKRHGEKATLFSENDEGDDQEPLTLRSEITWYENRKTTSEEGREKALLLRMMFSSSEGRPSGDAEAILESVAGKPEYAKLLSSGEFFKKIRPIVQPGSAVLKFANEALFHRKPEDWDRMILEAVQENAGEFAHVPVSVWEDPTNFFREFVYVKDERSSQYPTPLDKRNWFGHIVKHFPEALAHTNEKTLHHEMFAEQLLEMNFDLAMRYLPLRNDMRIAKVALKFIVGSGIFEFRVARRSIEWQRKALDALLARVVQGRDQTQEEHHSATHQEEEKRGRPRRTRSSTPRKRSASPPRRRSSTAKRRRSATQASYLSDGEEGEKRSRSTSTRRQERRSTSRTPDRRSVSTCRARMEQMALVGRRDGGEVQAPVVAEVNPGKSTAAPAAEEDDADAKDVRRERAARFIQHGLAFCADFKCREQEALKRVLGKIFTGARARHGVDVRDHEDAIAVAALRPDKFLQSLSLAVGGGREKENFPRDFVLAVCARNGTALQFASEAHKNDPEIAATAASTPATTSVAGQVRQGPISFFEWLESRQELDVGREPIPYSCRVEEVARRGSEYLAPKPAKDQMQQWEHKWLFLQLVQIVEKHTRVASERGPSMSRLVPDHAVGNREFKDENNFIVWPENYADHYIGEHDVPPTERFVHYIRYRVEQLLAKGIVNDFATLPTTDFHDPPVVFPPTPIPETSWRLLRQYGKFEIWPEGYWATGRY